MANPQVLCLSFDFYALGYVRNIARIEERKTFQKDKLIINDYSIEAHNFDNFFSVDNPVSLFNNIYWRYENIQIINQDSQLIWNGVIEDIVRHPENKTVTIQSKDTIQKYKKEKIEYESSDYETGAESALNVMQDIGLDESNYDINSIQASIDYLDYNNCKLKCNINESDNMTIIQFLNKIALYSSADCFIHNNKIYFKAWKPYTGGTNVSILNEDLIKITYIGSPLSNMYNDYSIGYYGDSGTSATDSNSNNIGSISRGKYGTHDLPELRSNDNKQIFYEDKTSATFIGEQYIKRSTKNYATYPQAPTLIKAQIDYSLRNWIDLETYFKLTLSDEVWDEKVFEIFKFVRDENKRELTIEAFEVIT